MPEMTPLVSVPPRACPWSPEKPWYTPMVLMFLTQDVPRLLEIPQQLFARDVHTIVHRLSAEGESFFTKTLPAFGKAIDLALQGHTPLRTTLFKKRGRTALPAFLQALLQRVFMDDGWVRSNPCVTAITLLRQITLWHKKLKKGYSDESLQKAADDFIKVDAVLPTCVSDMHGASGLLDVARAVVERIFANCGDPTTAAPGHGPGAVAGGEGTLGKRRLATSYKELEAVFRPIPWFFSLRDAAEDPQRVVGRTKQDFGLSRTAFVEKDSSGPRTIGLEPAEYMWCQQALKRLMYHHIEYKSIAKGHVNFTDQTINRRLAWEWQRYDTLDMSKASDRNSYALVEALFGRLPLWRYLRASRTPGTVLPDGRTLYYRKFAPMGSAVCFPVQAVVYYALACAAQHLAGMPLLLSMSNTYVYGDDLIVLHGQYHVIDDAFTKVGLVFNADKCCTHGRFRESCGMDAFDGFEVTPIRMRLADVNERADLAKLIEHSNGLMDAGYWYSALTLRSLTKSRFAHLRVYAPLSHRRDLPILTWRCAPWETSTLRYKTVKRRQPRVGPVRASDEYTGLSTVQGWVYEPRSVESSGDLEVFHLRESLCHGGPVGRLELYRPVGDPTDAERLDLLQVRRNCDPWLVRRLLQEKYSGGLRKRKFTVIREYGAE